jgi:Mn-dependent DtxR family transcriptional regulator
MGTYTEKQGQYLAFIYYYTKINRRPPAEADIQRYFAVTPPTVHQMILKFGGRRVYQTGTRTSPQYRGSAAS